MAKRVALLSLVLCALLSALANRSFSRARPPQTPAEQQRWMQEQQRKAQEQRLKSQEQQKAAQQAAHKIWEDYSDGEAWPQILDVTPEQWKAIKPKLARIKQLRSMPIMNASVYAFGGGSSTYSDSFHQGSGTGSGTGSGYAGGSARGSGGVGGGGRYVFGGQADGTAAARGTVGVGSPGDIVCQWRGRQCRQRLWFRHRRHRPGEEAGGRRESGLAVAPAFPRQRPRQADRGRQGL